MKSIIKVLRTKLAHSGVLHDSIGSFNILHKATLRTLHEFDPAGIDKMHSVHKIEQECGSFT